MKAFVSKVETLSDQSVKLSLYVPKEAAQAAFSLAYTEGVEVVLAKDFLILKDGTNWVMPENVRAAIITALCVMKDLLSEENNI